MTANDLICRQIPIIEYDEYGIPNKSNNTYSNCINLQTHIISKLQDNNLLSTQKIEMVSNIEEVSNTSDIVYIPILNPNDSISININKINSINNVNIRDFIIEDIKENIKEQSYILDPRIEQYTIDDDIKQKVDNFCKDNPGALLSEMIGMFCPEKKKDKNIGLIIGASVGGVVLIGLIIFLIIYLRKR
jgi:hypothetical protein